MKIRQAQRGDIPALSSMALRLWSGCARDEVEQDIAERFGDGEAFFLAEADGAPVGFAEVSLRHDYVEGSETSPVGYLEGVFVEEGYRRRGIAKALAASCEQWAAAEGCREFASDCRIENETSRLFHTAAGFTEASRIICFIKTIS